MIGDTSITLGHITSSKHYLWQKYLENGLMRQRLIHFREGVRKRPKCMGNIHNSCDC